MKGREAPAGRQVGVGPLPEEKVDGFSVAVVACKIQGRHPGSAANVYPGSVVDHPTGQVGGIPHSGHVEGGVAPVIRFVGVHSPPQKQAGRFRTVFFQGKMKQVVPVVVTKPGDLDGFILKPVDPVQFRRSDVSELLAEKGIELGSAYAEVQDESADSHDREDVKKKSN